MDTTEFRPYYTGTSRRRRLVPEFNTTIGLCMDHGSIGGARHGLMLRNRTANGADRAHACRARRWAGPHSASSVRAIVRARLARHGSDRAHG